MAMESPELLDRYLEAIRRRGLEGEDTYCSELENYQFELSIMSFRVKEKLQFADRSVFNRAALACFSGIGAVGSLMSAIWLGIAVSSPNQLDFLDLPLSAGDAGFLVRSDVMHNRDPRMPCLLAHAIRVDISQSMEPRSSEPLVYGLQDRADDREIGTPL